MRFSLFLLFPIILFAGGTGRDSYCLVLKYNDGTISRESVQIDKPEIIHLVAEPNPFNPAVVFHIRGLPVCSNWNFKIYSMAGQLVADLTPLLINGAKDISWKPQHLPSGLYFARLWDGSRSSLVKVALLK